MSLRSPVYVTVAAVSAILILGGLPVQFWRLRLRKRPCFAKRQPWLVLAQCIGVVLCVFGTVRNGSVQILVVVMTHLTAGLGLVLIVGRTISAKFLLDATQRNSRHAFDQRGFTARRRWTPLVFRVASVVRVYQAVVVPAAAPLSGSGGRSASVGSGGGGGGGGGGGPRLSGSGGRGQRLSGSGGGSVVGAAAAAGWRRRRRRWRGGGRVCRGEAAVVSVCRGAAAAAAVAAAAATSVGERRPWPVRRAEI